MKSVAVICVAIITLQCYLGGLQQGSSDGGGTGVDAWPVPNPEVVIICKVSFNNKNQRKGMELS